MPSRDCHEGRGAHVLVLLLLVAGLGCAFGSYHKTGILSRDSEWSGTQAQNRNRTPSRETKRKVLMFLHYYVHR